MAALAGIVFAAQIGFIPNQTGTGLEMKAIAACVLGGISLLGGSGTVVGAILGAYFLTQIDSVLGTVAHSCVVERLYRWPGCCWGPGI
ncbi:Autoinducer 2 import system permease protein lsrC [Serratia fonticola]|uniref:Autoinducer 2 import system permease protein LsrC n=1 Tax=Serratia fonticola TaxID=47917 RepID=A0A4U9TCM0_SERFO|nr:Autoinducer 2 import system permease protein lsrC [Serratia fonticola]